MGKPSAKIIATLQDDEIAVATRPHGRGHALRDEV